MKSNIITYLQTYGQETFSERAFSEVDALILCQFSYLKFEGIIPGIQTGEEHDADRTPDLVTILDIWRNPNRENMFYDTRFEEENRALAEAMLLSRRFKKARFGLFLDFVNEEEHVQFSAMTCLLEDGSVKIIYRGTDESIVGWREDMNMAFTYPIPGQEYSSRYLELAAACFDGPLDILGHSKGGNLAVYAAMNAPEGVQARIDTIYNMDGPGFKKGVCSLELFTKIEPKILKIIPRSSLVGMILENYGGYKVVDSSTVGLLQHFACSWVVDGRAFSYLEKVDEGQRIFNDALREWLDRLTEEEQRTFVDTLFEILEASGAADLVEFTQDYKGCITRMIGAFQNQDTAKKKQAARVIRLLFQISGETLKEQAQDWILEKLEK
ncbi:MAG: DUF2974 domain-containing protein [Lachnospiraceae bacterium]|nr:DUF2974 domain-containing protein [Lachnospiraceae bacterium]